MAAYTEKTDEQRRDFRTDIMRLLKVANQNGDVHQALHSLLMRLEE